MVLTMALVTSPPDALAAWNLTLTPIVTRWICCDNTRGHVWCRKTYGICGKYGLDGDTPEFRHSGYLYVGNWARQDLHWAVSPPVCPATGL